MVEIVTKEGTRNAFESGIVSVSAAKRKSLTAATERRIRKI